VATKNIDPIASPEPAEKIMPTTQVFPPAVVPAKRADPVALTLQLRNEAGYRVVEAKAAADRVSEEIRIEALKTSGLKADLARAIDRMEAAVQAHDTAVRNHQAAQKEQHAA
jgi:hypothetical protein